MVKSRETSSASQSFNVEDGISFQDRNIQVELIDQQPCPAIELWTSRCLERPLASPALQAAAPASSGIPCQQANKAQRLRPPGYNFW